MAAASSRYPRRTVEPVRYAEADLAPSARLQKKHKATVAAPDLSEKALQAAFGAAIAEPDCPESEKPAHAANTVGKRGRQPVKVSPWRKRKTRRYPLRALRMALILLDGTVTWPNCSLVAAKVNEFIGPPCALVPKMLFQHAKAAASGLQVARPGRPCPARTAG